MTASVLFTSAPRRWHRNCLTTLAPNPTDWLAGSADRYHAAGWEPWLLECVAGVLEPGETGAELARREAVEEANLHITALEPIARFLTSPGATSETVELFCGRTDAGAAGGVHGLEHEGEDIRVHSVPVADALALVAEGRIVNAKTIIALQWLALNYDALRARWV